MRTTIRTYSELSSFTTFEDRFRYLVLKGSIGEETFGFDRWVNQKFYRSREWKQVRDQIIVRDHACDLGVDGYEITDKILIHHMNPISVEDILNVSAYLMNPEYLVCVSYKTHNAIHFGNTDILNLIPVYPIERKPNDTCPWKT